MTREIDTPSSAGPSLRNFKIRLGSEMPFHVYSIRFVYLSAPPSGLFGALLL